MLKYLYIYIYRYFKYLKKNITLFFLIILYYYILFIEKDKLSDISL